MAREAAPVPSQHRRKSVRIPRKDVFCHHCGEVHEVSPHALSTICPGCLNSIRFEDIVISGNSSMRVDTRGSLHVEATGFLNSQTVICNGGLIEGRVTGLIRSEGVLRIATKGKLACRIISRSLHIERGAAVTIPHPIEVQELVVHGRLNAPVLCHGKVHVMRGGSVEGTVRALAMAVERGGLLIAESIVRREEPVIARAQPARVIEQYLPGLADDDLEEAVG